MNIKSSAIPAEWKETFHNFEKKMGYRFVLRRFERPKSVRVNEMMPVTPWWVNQGVAPVYADYTLAFAIDDAVISTNADLKKWLPGDQVFDDAVVRAGVAETGSAHASRGDTGSPHREARHQACHPGTATGRLV